MPGRKSVPLQGSPNQYTVLIHLVWRFDAVLRLPGERDDKNRQVSLRGRHSGCTVILSPPTTPTVTLQQPCRRIEARIDCQLAGVAKDLPHSCLVVSRR